MALVTVDEKVTYSELDALSDAYAAFLQSRAVVPGDKVLACMHNSVSSVALLLACSKAGAVFCPANWRLSCEELAALLDVEPFALAVVDASLLGVLSNAVDHSRCDIDIVLNEELDRKGAAFKPIDEIIDDSDIALQLFTSGTEGVPKGVLLSHDSLCLYAEAYSKASDWRCDDVYETSANIFHMAGFSAIVGLLLGNTVVLMDRFRMNDFIGFMVRERVTRVSLVPTLIMSIIHQPTFNPADFDNVRRLVYGGAPMLPQQLSEVGDKLSCAMEVAYGSTETCNISILTPSDHARIMRGDLPIEKLSSVGKPIEDVEVKIVSSKGERLPVGETGEIVVRSPYMYRGYSNAPEVVGIDGEGFHHTGDVGYLDADGYLYLVERKHDMIVCGGENIYPKEVEKCILDMEDDVRDAAIVGLANEYWGEIVVAFIVKQPGSSVEAHDVVDFCKRKIASYKKPKRVYFVESLPLNSNGKVDKRRLRRSAAELEQRSVLAN